ncbi:MAG: hypothetical protein Q9202_002130 [Teloschistes flavicans]
MASNNSATPAEFQSSLLGKGSSQAIPHMHGEFVGLGRVEHYLVSHYLWNKLNSFQLFLNMPKKPPPGQFSLLYFASAAAFTRKASENLPAPLTVPELFKHLEASYSGIGEMVLASCLLTINLEYVEVEGEGWETAAMTTIKEGDEVAIIPPVSSG